jgi:hypothetical protein
MTEFRTRPLEAGDEPEFNDAFNRFLNAGAEIPARLPDQMHWIWHRAPGGPALSWLVEAQIDGQWKIVGHHGLCPVRFTLGDQDWLCAKTMNSFLFSEFRDQFLYLRFEQECLNQADDRFHASYSIEPGATRFRSALGYQNLDTWSEFERGLQPLHFVYRTIAYLAHRYSYHVRGSLLHRLASITNLPPRKSPLPLLELTPAQAAASPFFRDFWAEARLTAGMAPSRDPADLDWRFWSRPSISPNSPGYSTLTYEWPTGGRAYLIVDTFSNPSFYSLVDFFITPAQPQRFAQLLDSLFSWAASKGALAIACRIVPRGQPQELLQVFQQKMRPFPLRHLHAKEMPRRLAPLGRARGYSELPPWNSTEILMADRFRFP